MKLIRGCNVAMILMVSGFVLWPGVSFAEPDLDVTMRMVTDDALSDSVVQQIQLPDPGAVGSDGALSRGAATPNRLRGPDKRDNSHRKNNAGDRGRYPGESIVDPAREYRRDEVKPQRHKPERPPKPDKARAKAQ